MMNEAITSAGAISADWVLVGVVSIFCFIIWNIFREMKGQIKENSRDIADIKEELPVLRRDVEILQEQYRPINSEALADEIIMKLKKMQPR